MFILPLQGVSQFSYHVNQNIISMTITWKMSHNLSSGSINFYVEHIGNIIARATFQPLLEPKCINLVFSITTEAKILKKLLHNFILFFFLNIMLISRIAIEIYSNKFRVGYQTNFPIIQLHVSSCFHGWYNHYSLVTSLMHNKDVHKRVCVHYLKLW